MRFVNISRTVLIHLRIIIGSLKGNPERFIDQTMMRYTEIPVNMIAATRTVYMF